MYFHASSGCLLLLVMESAIEPLTDVPSGAEAPAGTGATPTSPTTFDSSGFFDRA